MKTITTIFAMIVTMTFIGCGNATEEKTAENTDSTNAVAVDTTLVPAETTTTTAVDSAK